MSDQFELFAEEPEETKVEQKRQKVIKQDRKPAGEGPRLLYFDLETQKSAADVGGWSNSHLMKLAVGVVWDSLDRDYHVYQEGQAEELVKKLHSADLVIGFNVIGFDYSVLQPYASKASDPVDLSAIPTFDMLIDIHQKLKYRLSLNHLAQHTLGEEKSADGLISLQWYKEGKMDLIIDYCIQDVKVTRDLFLHGLREKELLFESKRGQQKLAVDWDVDSILTRLASKL